MEDTNHNKRYAGSNPNNWVCFGSSSITEPSDCDDNHKWRIIGVIDGKMKMMTNYYYTNSSGSTTMVWDKMGGANGSNNWGRPADLNTELNGDSFNNNNAYIDGAYRGYITNGTWYTGKSIPTDTYTLSAFIKGESSSSATGKIGLINMTDFGYAGSECTLSTNMNSINNVCMSNNWIVDTSSSQWTITPCNILVNTICLVSKEAVSSGITASKSGIARPALYLNQNVRMIDGTGTEENPYILGIVNGPVIGLSSESSNDKWIKATKIEVTATDTKKIESFKYEVFKDEKSLGEETVTVTENSNNASIEVPLLEDGEYSIKVTAINSDGAVSTKSSGIYKIDATAPTLTFEDITIKDNEVEEYDLMTGVTVSDNHGTPSVTTKGNLSKVVGEYEIEYTVTDEAGNSVTKTRKITVEKGLQTPTEIMEKDPGENGVIVTDTSGNKRFAGSNPNNWVCFGDSNVTDGTSCAKSSKWRIIGVFNGQMKIMTNYYYSTNEAWDSSNYNNWARPSTLNIKLNGNSFYGNDVFIDEVHRKYIANSMWYIGGPSGHYTLQGFIDGEKSQNTTRYIGLMSATDFGYAGSDCTLTTNLYSTNNVCMNDNWIEDSNYQWTITPRSVETNNVFYVNKSFEINYLSANESLLGGVRPALYLRQGVKISGGTGTESDPYILSKEPEVTDNDPGTNGKIVWDTYGNERYVGVNPKNWVCFGDSSITEPSNCDANHKWRIIGLFDGQMKIMTNYYYSESKAWDLSYSNNWGKPATLNTELNGASFYGNDTYIDNIHREYIVNGIWYTGSSQSGNNTFQAYIDGERNSNSTGHIGLMSVTDFGYAGSNCTLTTSMESGNNACMNDNWVGYSSNQWLITPYSGNTSFVYLVENTYKRVYYSTANSNTNGVRPALFLDPTVKITKGTGTSSDPYLLSR